MQRRFSQSCLEYLEYAETLDTTVAEVSFSKSDWNNDLYHKFRRSDRRQRQACPLLHHWIEHEAHIEEYKWAMTAEKEGLKEVNKI